MNENTIVNIISLYKPGKRLDNFLNILDILIDRKFDVSCVLQNYPEDILRILRLKRLDVMTCEAKNPSKARNEFLKKYYDSKYKYFIFLDDDVLLNTLVRTKEQDFIKYFLEEILKTKDDEVVITLQEASFVFRNLKNPTINETLHFWECAFIMKNIYKEFEIKVFFNEEINTVEGTAFSVDLFRKGFKVLAHYGQATFKQMIEESTYGNHEQRKETLRLNRIKIYELNKDIFNLTKNFQLRRKKNNAL